MTAARPEAPWRVFAAIRVPPGVATQVLALAAAAAEGRRPVRWVEAADLHLTLWFIGAIAPYDLPRLFARLAAAADACPPISCRLARAGTFGRDRARATWVGLAEPGAKRVAALAADLRPGAFVAHVTVGRDAPPALGHALAERLSDGPRLGWRATALELLRSHPGRRPVYETVATFRFGRRAAGRSDGPRRALLASGS